MHQLAVAKMLVFIHNKSQFILVQAHTEMGEAYLNYECYEQSIEHVTIALKKNSKLFQVYPESEAYHQKILTLLGKGYMEMNNIDDALELLNKAYEKQQKELENKIPAEDILQTLTCISQCHLRVKEFELALEFSDKLWNQADSIYGYRSKQCAMALVEQANIYAEKGDFASAIAKQN